MEINQELVEKYRDINVDHDWWDFTYEDFKNDMREKGIEVLPHVEPFLQKLAKKEIPMALATSSRKMKMKLMMKMRMLQRKRLKDMGYD